MEQEPGPDDPFQYTRVEARRAQLTLNFLVILSAVAGAAFFAYVLYSIRPFSSSPSDVVDIPTSGAAGVLTSIEGESGGLAVAVRDLDDAPGYAEALSERLRNDMGIEQAGRLLRLTVRNAGNAPLEVKLGTLQLTARDGREFNAQWLAQVADVRAATATGRLHIGQAAHEFQLDAGAERQLSVFVPGDVPAVGELRAGKLGAGAMEVPLEYKETRAAP